MILQNLDLSRGTRQLGKSSFEILTEFSPRVVLVEMQLLSFRSRSRDTPGGRPGGRRRKLCPPDFGELWRGRRVHFAKFFACEARGTCQGRHHTARQTRVQTRRDK